MNTKIYVAILAGGAGTRFWPISTMKKPKQFHAILSSESMLQLTIKRLSGFVPNDHIYIITGEQHIPETRRQLPDCPAGNIIGEPQRKDTSAAIMLGAGIIHSKNPDAVMIVLPADHLIEPVDDFIKTLEKAVRVAESGGLVTFGIKPTFPAESYGYLEKGERLTLDDGTEYFALNRFVEKPDKKTAGEYIASGKFLWNSGMFIWRTEEILKEIKQHIPVLYESFLPVCSSNTDDPDWKSKLNEAFEKVPRISIDFGVMEKVRKIYMVQADFKWSDVGGWLALKDILEKDKNGNYIKSKFLSIDSAGNIIISDDPDYPILCAGIQDSVIVISKNGALICHQNQTEKIKEIVEKIQ